MSAPARHARGALAGTVVLGAALVASALFACTTGSAATPASDAPLPPSPADPASAAREQGTGLGEAPPPREPRDIVELFATRILPTCSVNGGVCHNANNYPDLRNVAAMEDLVDLPCGRNAAPDLPDVCEPNGDHLVAGSGLDGLDVLDVLVERVSFDASTLAATITTGADVPSGALDDARARVDIRRAVGGRLFAASAAGASFTVDGRRTVTAHLATATAEAQAFFDPKLPLRDDRIWPADANGNGIEGATSAATAGFREIVPGRPDLSYVVARLWDTSLVPELMPRQCRLWDDAATRALGCWIENLRVDEEGAVRNFYAPIDYARCAFVVPRAGRCGGGP